MAKQTHFSLRNTEGGFLFLKTFACIDCGRTVKPGNGSSQVKEKPVTHSVQGAKCAHCEASYFILSAKTEEDCEILRPILDRIYETFTREPPR
jgi:hypothetical protein